jgi:hypothetical protein
MPASQFMSLLGHATPLPLSGMKWTPGSGFMMGSDGHYPEEAPRWQMAPGKSVLFHLIAELAQSPHVRQCFGSDSKTRADPMIGLRGRRNFIPEVFLTSWAMIEGFGVFLRFYLGSR